MTVLVMTGPTKGNARDGFSLVAAAFPLVWRAALMLHAAGLVSLAALLQLSSQLKITDPCF